MSSNTDLIYDVKRKILAKYPRFGSEIATSQIVLSNNIRTSSTDGKNIYLNPEYFAKASEDVRIYLLAHEIFHKKFKHMYRLKDKNGNMRDLELWNIVCDAITNANLKRDGIKIPDGRKCSNTDNEYGDWVLKYNCEELYELKEEEKKQKEQQNGQEQGDGQDNNKQKSDKDENQNSNEDKLQGDDHSLWKEVFKQQTSKEKGQKQNNTEKQQEQQAQQQEQIDEEQIDMDFDERGEFEDNRKEKREKFKSRREKIQKNIRSSKEETIKLGNIGESKESIDWKVLLRREVEKTETIWGQRRSIAENNYAYRLEENDIEDEVETEVMIDVSGSVNEDLVKGFLRQLKPLLKESKLKVGCFNTKFWGFVDINNLKDIDNLNVPRGGGTDLDLPVRSFTKKREINKIVFTDGYPCHGTMPKEDLKRENVIWLVYGNKDFRPCCGKVINITEKQLEQLHQIDKSSSIDDFSR